MEVAKILAEQRINEQRLQNAQNREEAKQKEIVNQYTGDL